MQWLVLALVRNLTITQNWFSRPFVIGSKTGSFCDSLLKASLTMENFFNYFLNNFPRTLNFFAFLVFLIRLIYNIFDYCLNKTHIPTELLNVFLNSST